MANERHIVVPSVVIAAGVNDTFLVNEDSAGDTTATIAPGTYYLLGDGTASDLLEAYRDALDGIAGGVGVYTTNIDLDTFLVTVLCDIPYRVTWGDFDGVDLGYLADLTDDAEDQDTDSFPRGFWLPDACAERVDEKPRALGSQIATVGGQTYTHDRSGQAWSDLIIVWPWLEEDHVEALGLSAANQPRTLYKCWERWRDGRPLQIHSALTSASNLSSSTLIGTFVLDGAHLQAIHAQRQGPGVPFYTTEPVLFREWVAQ